MHALSVATQHFARLGGMSNKVRVVLVGLLFISQGSRHQVCMCFLDTSTQLILPQVAASCTHPLDVTKVYVFSILSSKHLIIHVFSRMQTIKAVAGSKRPSTVAIIRASLVQSGFPSLYAGLTASLMRQMSYSLVRLGSYEKMKAYLSRDGRASTPNLFVAACLAGGLGGIAGNPAGMLYRDFGAWFWLDPDIILVRMTSDLTRAPDKRYAYSNALAGLVSLVKQEGLQGLTRGLGTNTVCFGHFVCWNSILTPWNRSEPF